MFMCILTHAYIQMLGYAYNFSGKKHEKFITLVSGEDNLVSSTMGDLLFIIYFLAFFISVTQTYIK